MEAELCAGLECRDLLARHKTRIERTFHRCLKELKALQTNAFLQVSLRAAIRENILFLASANEVAKRTQYLDQHDPLGARFLRQVLTDTPATAHDPHSS
jgi:hypothetical protein